MRSNGRLLRFCAVASGLVLGGCAPTFGSGMQFGIASGPGLNLNVSSCSLLGPSPEAARLGVRSSASSFNIEQIQSLQMKAVTFGATTGIGSNPAGWKRIAGGAC